MRNLSSTPSVYISMLPNGTALYCDFLDCVIVYITDQRRGRLTRRGSREGGRGRGGRRGGGGRTNSQGSQKTEVGREEGEKRGGSWE